MSRSWVKPLGAGVIGEDGRFSIQVAPLVASMRVGLGVGDLEGTGFTREMLFVPEYGGLEPPLACSLFHSGINDIYLVRSGERKYIFRVAHASRYGPFGESDFVPDRDRFKLGGPSTVRGYDYQEIGPGDFMIVGNVEARVPLFWKFAMGVFLDGGNAWEEANDVQVADFRPFDTDSEPDEAAQDDVRYSAGAGLRFATPVGTWRGGA